MNARATALIPIVILAATVPSRAAIDGAERARWQVAASSERIADFIGSSWFLFDDIESFQEDTTGRYRPDALECPKVPMRLPRSDGETLIRLMDWCER